MFDENKCKECLCSTCVYDYGVSVGARSILCKDVHFMGCERCKTKGVNYVSHDCDDYVRETDI